MNARALLIGCGNIGALYDLEREGVLTHAKALATLSVPFDIVEIDEQRAAQVTARYGGRAFRSLDAVELATYSIASIASPTSDHPAQLVRLLGANVAVVICEKPIAARASDLLRVRDARSASRSLVFVNYIRRFQPAYAALAQHLASYANEPKSVQGITVRYQRGFLNNASHALDLLSMLFGRLVDIARPRVLRSAADAFADDPTLSLAFDWSGVPVFVLGHVASGYGIFEIDIELRDARVRIHDRGDRIDWLVPDGAGGFIRDEGRSATGAIADYMLPVMRRALEGSPENFDSAYTLNLKLCDLLANLPAET